MCTITAAAGTLLDAHNLRIFVVWLMLKKIVAYGISGYYCTGLEIVLARERGWILVICDFCS